MSAVKRHGSDLRDEYAAQTRRRIVAAFVESLQDEGADDVSMAAIAKRANVAERTIYRHFKTRAELLTEAGEWIVIVRRTRPVRRSWSICAPGTSQSASRRRAAASRCDEPPAIPGTVLWSSPASRRAASSSSSCADTSSGE